MTPDREKRAARRIAHAAPVKVRIQSCPGHADLEGAVLEGTTRDISLNGIRLHLDQVLPLNTALEAEITFAEHRYLLAGRVVWSHRTDATHADAGLLFMSVDESQMGSWKLQVARVFQAGK